jgi:hypothetical protein
MVVSVAQLATILYDNKLHNGEYNNEHKTDREYDLVDEIDLVLVLHEGLVQDEVLQSLVVGQDLLLVRLVLLVYQQLEVRT